MFRFYSWFKLGTLLGALILLWPFAQTIQSLLMMRADEWVQLDASYLVFLSWNTIKLLILTVVMSSAAGVFFAWYMKLYALPWKRFIHYCLLLPMAIPSYVGAFVFVGLWDYSGSVQQCLREIGILKNGFDIRTGSVGVALALSTVLFPYVYLLSCAAFDRQSDSVLKAARLYGGQNRLGMVVLLLKLIRPGILGGALLVAMEVLADFGVVSMFNYETFTLAIYTTWIDYRSTTLAIALSLNLVVLAIFLVVIEQWSRGKRRYANLQLTKPSLQPLNKGRFVFFYAVCLLWLGIGLFLPLIQLSTWAISSFQPDARYWSWLGNSLTLTLLGGGVIIVIGIVFSYTIHRFKGSWLSSGLKIFGVGYALPGTMLGIVMLIFWQTGGAGWVGSILLILWAYTLRFLPLVVKSMGVAWDNIGASLEKAAYLYSHSRWQRLKQFYLPALSTSITSAAVLLMLDLFKELPITLMLRSVGWDTLPVRIYNLASEGLYEAAAPAALIIISVTCALYVTVGKFKWVSGKATN